MHWIKAILDCQNCLVCGGPSDDGYPPIWARKQALGQPDVLASCRTYLCASCLARLPYSCEPWSYLPESRIPYAHVFDYAGPVRDLIVGLKFSGQRLGAKVLAAFASHKLEELGYRPQYLIPLPLSPLRERERSYNQAEVICREMGEILGIKILENFLIRTRDTMSQASLKGYRARFANLEGAFAFGQAPSRKMRGKSVLLVDDVLTSGASCLNASKVLVQAGMKVRVLTMAEQGLHFADLVDKI